MEYKPSNRDRKQDKDRTKPVMHEHGRGLKTVILPLLGKKAKEVVDKEGK